MSNMQVRRTNVDEHGFAIIPRVLSGQDIAGLTEHLASAQLHRTKAGIRHALRVSAIAEVAQDTRLLEIARGSLGPGAIPFRATLFDKTPQSNWLVAWHQDTALPLRAKRETSGWGPWSVKEEVIYANAPASALEQVLALRLQLDESTAHNGPLRVLPGSHKMGVLSNDAVHELVQAIPSVDCLVPKGGVLAMRPLLVHASSKLKSNERRRVLHIEYAASPLTQDGLELAFG